MSRTALVTLTAIAVSLVACGGGVPDQFSHGSEVTPVSSAAPAAEAGTGGGAGSAATQVGASAGAPLIDGNPTLPDSAASAAGAPDTPPTDLPPVDTSALPPTVPPSPPPAPVMPVCASEQCNGKDDDCDGIIDEGCPVGFSPGNPVQRGAIGDSWGGTQFADTCAADEVLVGVTVAVGAWLDQVTAVCQKFSLSNSTTQVPYQYELKLGARRSLASHPTTASSLTSDLSCRNGTVLVGLHISQQHTAYGQVNDFVVIPQISIKCAEAFLSLNGDQPHVEWMNPVDVGPVTGSFANPQAWFRTDVLDVTDLPSGFHGSSGAWLDRVGLTANPVRVLLK